MTEVVVASFNTHWGEDRDGTPFDAVRAIGALAADVVCLQEAWRPGRGQGYAAEAAAAFGYELFEEPLFGGQTRYTRLARAPKPGADAGAGLAVLTRLPCRSVRRVPLGRARGDVPRVALDLDLDVGGTPLRCVTTHLCWMPHGSVAQLGRLRRRFPPGDAPGVVAGDMNMWGPVVAARMRGWRRAVRGRSWPAHRPHSQIDHILVSGGVEVLGAEVLAETGSDHRPVRVRLGLS